MNTFRSKYNPAELYELLLEILVADVAAALGRTPNVLHFDPCSSFTSRSAFTQRLESRYPNSRVSFVPDSQREKGLQAADMMAGAVRRCSIASDTPYWNAVAAACGATLRELSEAEMRRRLRK